MKYSQSIIMINDTIAKLQNDINDNPNKYLKDNRINEKAIISKLNISKKIANNGWIEKSDIDNLVSNKNIKIKHGDNKCSFYLTNNRNNEIGFVKKMKINYIIKDNQISVVFYFVFTGDYLEFINLLDFNFVLTFDIDISNINTVIKLINNGKVINSNYYKVVNL